MRAVINTVVACILFGLLTGYASAEKKDGLDHEFLLLPAYDILAELPAEGLRVGDRIKMKVGELTISDVTNANKELKLGAAPGSDSISDQGWELLAGDSDAAAPLEFSFSAVPLKAGRLTLSSLGLIDASGKFVARTNPLTVEVQSAIRPDDPTPNEPVDLRPPVGLRFPWWILVVVAVVVLFLVVAGVYALKRWNQRHRPPAVAPLAAGPPIPEDERALLALAEVERFGHAKRGDFKAHYFSVSEILKAYVGARFGFDALEMTSRELILELEKQQGRLVDELNGLFARLDLVKFTDHRPGIDSATEVLESARRFVRSTRRPAAVVQASLGHVYNGAGRDAS